MGSGTLAWCVENDIPLSISIHPLRGEWDGCVVVISFADTEFQSTHSVGSGTDIFGDFDFTVTFQSTHSVGSGTTDYFWLRKNDWISIHPLRGEWDPRLSTRHSALSISIHPLRGEWDSFRFLLQQHQQISIHPLRGEWDFKSKCHAVDIRISIHPLRGEWDFCYLSISIPRAFQSTHSVGSGTKAFTPFIPDTLNFNQPTPWGVGHFVKISVLYMHDFNPPTPWGVGLRLTWHILRQAFISIHPLRGEWDC